MSVVDTRNPEYVQVVCELQCDAFAAAVGLINQHLRNGNVKDAQWVVCNLTADIDQAKARIRDLFTEMKTDA